MPHINFELLPPNARVWVFGAATPLADSAKKSLLNTVDEHLSQWRAHGVPLVCSRDVKDERFVAVGVDEAATGASGCSIDGLFRTLSELEKTIGTTLVGGGRLFWRNSAGEVESGPRSVFVAGIDAGTISAMTPVFDLTLTTVGDWREKFEKPLGESWHARLLLQR